MSHRHPERDHAGRASPVVEPRAVTLYVHRAERADALASGLADLLSTPLPDAFAVEVVAVPARGIERWLTQRLSHTLGAKGAQAGVCAGVRFPAPAALVADVLGVDERDPWAPDSLVWPLLDAIDAHASEPWCSALGRHLGVGLPAPEAGARRGRRYAVARRLAGLFDSYATTRPSLIESWAAGRDDDGLRGRLAPDLAWQPVLWRLVREQVPGPHPVERIRAAVAALRHESDADAGAYGALLPDRLSVFGPTRLPAIHLELLEALAVDRDVHLWLPYPSPTLWAALADLAVAVPRSRRDDPAADVAQNPLLASLGRDARELAEVLGAVTFDDRHHPALGGAGTRETLLTQLQRDLRDDRRRSHDERVVLDAGDRSVVVHACHGPTRQVEVLREELVGLLAADPTLEPRDILVMCPDVEVYAPLVSAAFGLADVVEGGHPAHELRVRLADRALRRTNPLLATAARLLVLADDRVTASQVLDLAARAPVRRRFGFDDDAVARLSDWVAAANVRWGLSADQRGAYGLGAFEQNTWRAGLDRILVGAAMAEHGDNVLGRVLPLSDVGSNDIELVGLLAELVSRLDSALRSLRGPQSLAAWVAAIDEATLALTTTSEADGWQRAELQRELQAVLDAAGPDGSDTMLALSDVRSMLGGRLGGRPTRANFRTGTLTVCTMVPMRSVPHRVICLLGLDDGVFPRGSRLDGDDVLARDPAVGERDARGEDRQLLLDAILAAQERLVITYSGHDERTGAPRPPAVPLGELLDALDDTAVASEGRPARAQVVVAHPLQPYDPRVFTPGALGVPGPFGYDPTAFAGARAALGPRTPTPAFLAQPLAADAPPVVELALLTEAVIRPVRAFVRQRLEVGLPYEADEPSDALAVELDGLAAWGVGDRVLRDRLAGVDRGTVDALEWRRGFLPPGPLGQRTLQAALAKVEPLVAGTEDLRAEPLRTVDVTVRLDDGREIRGTVPGVRGSVLVSVGYSKLGARARLGAWLGLLVLTAAYPETGWTAITVGRPPHGQGARAARVGPLEPAQARTTLAELVALADCASAEPLPMVTKTSAAYADRRHRGGEVPDALHAARKEWTSTDRFSGEDADAAAVLVWGRNAELERLLDVDLRADERWFPAEVTRFGQLARRLWTPLLDVEQEGPL